MIIVGIDPGKEGGIVGIDDDKRIMFLEVMPQEIIEVYHLFQSLKKKNHIIMVYLEKAQAFPQNGSVAMFNYGKHCGELEGVLTVLGLPYELVPPQAWTRRIHFEHKKYSEKSSKEKSKEAVVKLFPGIKLTDPNKPKATKYHEGIIDALLIAEDGRQRLWKRVKEPSGDSSHTFVKTPES